MTKRRLHRGLMFLMTSLFLFSLALLVACSSVNIRSTVSEGFANHTYQTLMIFGQFRNELKRDVSESIFSKRLALAGFSAYEGAGIIPEPETLSRNEYLTLLEKHGIDAVLFVSPLRSGDRSPKSPFSTTVKDHQVEAPSTGCNPKDGDMRYEVYQKKSKTSAESISRSWIELKYVLFDVASGKIAWQAEAKLQGVGSPVFAELINTQAEEIVRQLQQDGLIE